MLKLMTFELVKIFKNRTVLGALVVTLLLLFGIFFVGYHYSQANLAGTSNAADGYPARLDTVIQEKYSGDLTDEKVAEIITDFIDLFQENIKDGQNVGPFYPFYWEVANNFIDKKDYDIYLTMLDGAESGHKLTIDEVPLISLADTDFKQSALPLQLGNYVPWTDLYKVLGNLAILISIFVALVCSLVFADDTSRNMNQTLFTTKNGRNRLLVGKLLAGISVSSIFFILIHSINLITFSIMNDSSGWNSSIQTNFTMKLFDFPLEWNHLQVYLWLLGLQFVGILFVAACSLLVSSFVKTPISAFATATGLYFLPSLLMRIFPTSNLLSILPINQVSAKKMLILFSSESDFLGNGLISNTLILVGILLLAYCVLNILAYQKMKGWKFG